MCLEIVHPSRIWLASLLLLGTTLPSAAQCTEPGCVLVWSDEFDGSELDLTRWEPQIGDGTSYGLPAGWGNFELEYYRAENATVGGGVLTITAREEPFAGYAYTSARLRTLGLGDWTYGRMEMRARMPIGQGLWPAFWMLPSDPSIYGTWAASGEIDIMEYLGSEPDEVFGTLHYGGPWPENVFTSNGYTLPSGTFHDEFHVFAVEWERGVIRWYVDGELYATQTSWYSTGGPYPAPFDVDFHLVLNLAVGGTLPGPPDPTTTFPQELVVDYVRVYRFSDGPSDTVVFDDMEHGAPFDNGWFAFGGDVGGGGIGANTADLPPSDGGVFSLEAGYGSGGVAGFVGGFGRTNPLDLTNATDFEFWILPDAGQEYVIEINLQDDDDGDDAIAEPPDGADDEFQFECVISATGPCAIAGGGWQRVSIPLTEFTDDGSYHFGGNGVFDPTAVGAGGNGRLVNIVMTLISTSGADATFRTDYWTFTDGPGEEDVLFDDFEDGDGSDWVFFSGNLAGGDGAVASDRPAEGEHYFSTSWSGEGSVSSFYGGLFSNVDDGAQLAPPAEPYFNVWVLNQSDSTADEYRLEITLREDLDGNGWTDGQEDSFRLDTEFTSADFDDEWLLVSAPLSQFMDLFTGGNGVFDGKLDEVVVVIGGVVGASGSTVEVDFDLFSLSSGAPIRALSAVGACPGGVTVVADGMTPGAGVVIAWSSSLGTSEVPSGSCAGTPLALASPQLLTQGTTDAGGRLALDANAPNAACGALLQAVDLTTCETTSVATVP